MNSPSNYNKYLETLENAHKLRFSDPQKALDDANTVYIHAVKSNDLKLEARSLFEMGLCYELAASYPKAMNCLSESIKISKSTGDIQLMADALNYAGIIHDKLNNYSKALKAYFNASRYYDFLEDKKKKAIVLSNIGLIYTNIQDYKSALKFYSQALEIAEDENDTESLLVTNINIGLTHRQLGNYKDAEKFLYDSIEIADGINDKHRKSLALDILGETAGTQHNNAKAYELLNISLDLKKELNDKKGISKIQSFLGKLQLTENRLEDAKFSFLEALVLAEEVGLKKSVFEIHKLLSEIYEKQEIYGKALEHLKISYKTELEYLKEESELKSKNITTQLEIEQAQKEAEAERLKNVELGRALQEVKQLNISLKELNDEKNEFMAIAVHDLKNPLLNILSAARIIKNRESLSNEQTDEFTDNIITQTDRMFGLIKKLLDHNAIEQGNIQLRISKFGISEILEELIQNFAVQANNKNIRIDYENNSPNAEINTDKVILYEILQNLLSNAIKFSPYNKPVVLKTYTNEKDMFIEIKDEGPGFTEEDKKKIFTKFAKLSAKPTGDEHTTGLGLSIVKKLTDFINAKISFESEFGKGTKFTLILQISKE